VHGNFEAVLDDFFLEQFEVDFLWIETTNTLIEQPWFYTFERKLCDFNIESKTPIIFLVY
jgi:hypothetical protein